MQATETHLNRWWHVVGGVTMNLALGSLYGWSVFVAPLEKEFHWKRADTSNVFIIAVVVFALSFIVAGRLQDPRAYSVLFGKRLYLRVLRPMPRMPINPDAINPSVPGSGVGWNPGVVKAPFVNS